MVGNSLTGAMVMVTQTDDITSSAVSILKYRFRRNPNGWRACFGFIRELDEEQYRIGQT